MNNNKKLEHVDLIRPKPLYQTVADHIRGNIEKGQYEIAVPTEMSLVQQFGVSQTTVRGALKLLAREQFLRRQQGKGTFIIPHRGRANVTTLVFSYPDAFTLHHPYFSRLYHGFEDGINEFSENTQKNISIQCIRQARKDDGTLYNYTLIRPEDPIQSQVINPNYVKGICLTPTVSNDEILEVRRRGTCCVLLGNCDEDGGFGVYFDKTAIELESLSYLKGLGHRDIGLVGTKVFFHKTKEKMAQKLKGQFDELGLNIDDRFIVMCDSPKQELAFEGVMKLLKGPNRPTALWCYDDFLALGARDAAYKMGLSVPGDLSIIGYGDYIPSAGITTVAHPSAEIGRKAACLLTALIFNQYDGPEKIWVNNHELIVRGSTGRVPCRKVYKQ